MLTFSISYGARSRTRTGTDVSSPRDFKSLVSTYSTIRALEKRTELFVADLRLQKKRRPLMTRGLRANGN